MSIEKLEDILKGCHKEGKPSFFCVEVEDIFKEISNIFKSQQAQIAELQEKVKKLEQAKTYYPMTAEYKHRALLNNCVNDDEAILHKKEIERLKDEKKI